MVTSPSASPILTVCVATLFLDLRRRVPFLVAEFLPLPSLRFTQGDLRLAVGTVRIGAVAIEHKLYLVSERVYFAQS